MNTPLAAPRTGDVIFLGPTNFVYVGEQLRDDKGRFLPPAPLGDGCFEATAESGEAYIVARAPERDEEFHSAVHDDGRRRAWRTTISLRPWLTTESAALDRQSSEG